MGMSVSKRTADNEYGQHPSSSADCMSSGAAYLPNRSIRRGDRWHLSKEDVEKSVRKIQMGQSSQGAFLSFILLNSRQLVDENGFTTGLVLRALSVIPDLPMLSEVRQRALGFLRRCESLDRPGAFGFWPKGDRPSWGKGMTEDADDTAVLTLELFRNGYLQRSEVRKIICTRLIPYRLGAVSESAPVWARPGAFLTWLHPKIILNPVDCCVNANVVALLAYADLSQMAGYGEACRMILDAIQWAGKSWQRARSLVPFYPAPAELFYAVRHAVQCGAKDLGPALEELRNFKPVTEITAQRTLSIERPIFGSSDGKVVWVSPVLAEARILEEKMMRHN